MYCDNISMLIVKVAPDGLSLRTRSQYAQGDTATVEVKQDFVRGVGVGKVVSALYPYKLKPIIYKTKICISSRLILWEGGTRELFLMWWSVCIECASLILFI